MSSVWSHGASQAGASSFATTGVGPKPGGMAAGRFPSILSRSSPSPPGAISGLSSNASPAQLDTSAASASSQANAAADASDSSATISANDFLSLLVTEMQNQDPTAQTDPNEYINQLVQINSLEQLISINQNLSTALGSTTTSQASAVSTAPASSAAKTAFHSSANAVVSHVSQSASALHRENGSGSERAAYRNGRGTPPPIRGNLSVFAESPAAHAVARTLDGHPGAVPRGHAIRDIPVHSLP